jgi:hypothetical protein
MPGREPVAAVAAEVVDVLKRSHEEGNAPEAEDAAGSGSPRTRRYVSLTIPLFLDARGRKLTKWCCHCGTRCESTDVLCIGGSRLAWGSCPRTRGEWRSGN